MRSFLTSLLVLVLLSGIGNSQDIVQWEYKVWLQPDRVEALSDKALIEKKLNEFGASGWELVSVMWRNHGNDTRPPGRAIFYFKRCLAPQPQPDLEISKSEEK